MSLLSSLPALIALSQPVQAETLADVDQVATEVVNETAQVTALLSIVYGVEFTKDEFNSGVDSIMPALSAELKNCSIFAAIQAAPMLSGENPAFPFAEAACTSPGFGPIESAQVRFGRTFPPMIPTEWPTPHSMPFIGYPNLGVYDDIETIDEGVLVDLELKRGVDLTLAVLDGSSDVRLTSQPNLMVYGALTPAQLEQLRLEAGAQHSLDSTETTLSASVRWNGDRLKGLTTVAFTPRDENVTGGSVVQLEYLANPDQTLELSPFARVVSPNLFLPEEAQFDAQLGLQAKQSDGPFTLRVAVGSDLNSVDETKFLSNVSLAF